MPPLLLLSPVILDHSFPRTQSELRLVALAIGEVQETVDAKHAAMLTTSALNEYIELFDWEGNSQFPQLQLIHSHLSQLVLRNSPYHVPPTLLDGLDSEPHPVPSTTSRDGLSEEWAIEVGRILVLHDDAVSDGSFFIGVACELAFAGHDSKGYREHPDTNRSFPLIGPADVLKLANAFVSDIPGDFAHRRISFECAKNHIGVLGGELHNPKGGSHYTVEFPKGFKWTLDRNHNPVLDRHLKQVATNLSLELCCVKYALLTRKMPPTKCRLPVSQGPTH